MRKILVAPLLVIIGLSGYVAIFTNHAYVTTPSMYPTIPPGSLAFVRKQPAYHVGDIIEFRGNGLAFLHRIVAIKSDGRITTKGDNPQNAPDVFAHPTTSAVVIGKVVMAPRWLGFPELILHRPSYGLAWLRAELGVGGKLLVLGITALLVFLVQARRNPSATREQDRLKSVPSVDLTRDPMIDLTGDPEIDLTGQDATNEAAT